MEEEEFDIKKTKKERYSAIKFESNHFEPFNQKELENFFTVESTMLNQDKLIIETYEKKNELESSIYSWKEKLNNSHKPYAKPESIPDIIAFLEAQNEWLYNDG
jgi:heat shock protein 4